MTLKRMGWTEFFDEGIPSVPFWMDCPLYDIETTVENAVRAAARSGARAVTVAWAVRKYAGVMALCRELGLDVYTVREPDFVRVKLGVVS